MSDITKALPDSVTKAMTSWTPVTQPNVNKRDKEDDREEEARGATDLEKVNTSKQEKTVQVPSKWGIGSNEEYGESNDDEDEGEEETERDEESSEIEDITSLYTTPRTSSRVRKQTKRYQPCITADNKKTKVDGEQVEKSKKKKNTKVSSKPSGKGNVERRHNLETEKEASREAPGTRNKIHNVLSYPLVHPLIVVFRLFFYNEITAIIQGRTPGTISDNLVDILDPTGRLYRRFQYCAYYQYLSIVEPSTSCKDERRLVRKIGLTRSSYFRYFQQLYGALKANKGTSITTPS